ncbi:hypothetical protein ABH932_002343 [Streptacidiphilus sp. MAP5-52]
MRTVLVHPSPCRRMNQDRWRAISGAHLVAPVRSGARFENGIRGERGKVTA